MSEISDLAFSFSDDAIAERAEVLRLRSVLDDLIKAAEPFTKMATVLSAVGLIAHVRVSDEVDYKITGADLRSLSESVRKAKEGIK